MSDSDKSSTAWKLAPSAYLAARGLAFAIPKAPISKYVTMRDGCRIAVDVWLPATKPGGVPVPGRLPAITVFTPYYRRFKLLEGAPEASEVTPNAARYRDMFVPGGYALVVSDVRGTGASFGTRDGFRSTAERLDYGEIVDWVIGQPWSDGSVGAMGISYLGAATDFLASTGHPAIKAVAPLFSVWDTYTDQLFPGGLLINSVANAYADAINALDEDKRDLLAKFANWKDLNLVGPQPVDEDTDGQLLREAIRQHRSNFNLKDYINEFRCRDDHLIYDESVSPATFSPCTYWQGVRKDLAVMSASGWFDGGGYTNGSIARFLTLPNVKHTLLLGPWDHGARVNVSPWRSRALPEFALMAEVLRFFDNHLSGRDTGLEAEAPIHYFSMHAETWRAAQKWPPLNSTLTLFLGGDNTLAPAESSSGGFDDYQVDFTLGTGAQTRYERIGVMETRDYYADWHGRDAAMLSYTSAPLAMDAEHTGHALVTLHLESSEPDMALHLYLSEIEADGRTRYVTEGVLRGVHREVTQCPDYYRASWPWRSYARGSAKPMPLNQPVKIIVALLPVSWEFRKGSRLRLSISGADRDHYSQTPHGRPPRFRILRGPGVSSCIELPWIEHH